MQAILGTLHLLQPTGLTVGAREHQVLQQLQLLLEFGQLTAGPLIQVDPEGGWSKCRLGVEGLLGVSGRISDKLVRVTKPCFLGLN